eukprot:TRINITY_DN1478_c0_g2_i1.p1 TRINITY_DN1478_c0_g2~~TRINITY_DN1478_c0_g2_i1.p1  ORF type:complete len:640 (-),score=120.86 TRINITY_DN1478_c0_g2_i1:111-1931(-)
MEKSVKNSRVASNVLLRRLDTWRKKFGLEKSEKENSERHQVPFSSKKRKSIGKSKVGSRRRLSDMNEVDESQKIHSVRASGRSLLKVVEDAAPLCGDAYLNGSREDGSDDESVVDSLAESVMDSVAETSMLEASFYCDDSVIEDDVSLDESFQKELIPKKNTDYVPSPKTPGEHQQKLRTEVQDTIEEILHVLAGYQKELLASEAGTTASLMPDTLSDLVAQAHRLSFEQLVRRIKTLAKVLVFGEQDLDGEQATEGLSQADACALFIHRMSHTLLRIKSLVAAKQVPPHSSFRRAVVFHQLVTAIRLYLESDDEAAVPGDLAPELLEALAAEALTATTAPMAAQDEACIVRRCRVMLRRANKWREACIVVTPSTLCLSCMQDDKFAKQVINMAVASVTAIVYTLSSYMIKLKSAEHGIIKFKCGTRSDFYQLLVAINGVRGAGQQSLISESDKFVMMKFLYKKFFKTGGSITSSGHEQWQYNSNGTVVQVVGSQAGLQFQWDGENFRALAEADAKQLGEGRWNGVWLGWHASQAAMATQPYIWCADKREFVEPDNSHLSWKWKKSVLSSQSLGISDTHWTIDGQVPEPVVMFVQMLRYHRIANDL